MPAVKPGMIGVFGQTHFELEHLIDLKTFDDIQLDILKGMALSKKLTIRGQFRNPIVDEQRSYVFDKVKPMFHAYEEFMALPDSDPVKQIGLSIREQDNHAFVEFMKFAYGAHDHYTVYNFWDGVPGWKADPKKRPPNEIAEYFPSLLTWIESLITAGIFTHVGRAYIVSVDSFGISFEHRDNQADPQSDTDSEFIHVRLNTKRPFYVYNAETKERFYIESRVGWWNDKDTHGGDPIAEPAYAVRIDGVFTEEFRNKIKNETIPN